MVHSGPPSDCRVNSILRGFLWRHRGRQVHSGSRGFSRTRLAGILGHSGSRGFTTARLGVVGFIRVRMGSLGCTYGSSGSRRFTQAGLVVFVFTQYREGAFGHA